MSGLKMMRFALVTLATGAFAAVSEESGAHRACPVSNVALRSGAKATGDFDKYVVHFTSAVDVELDLLYIDPYGEEFAQGTILPLSDTTRDSYGGHAFRVRATDGTVLREVVMGGANKNIAVKVEACGAVAAALASTPLVSKRAAEFEALLHAPDKPCEGPSSEWSCVKYTGEAELRERDPTAYGIQPGETHQGRWHTTVDHTYVSQIGRIPAISPGPGYAKMTFTDAMRDAVGEWYQLRRNDSMKTHGTIPGGYTNNDHVLIDRIDLDKFPKVHGLILREMREILQWWTGLRLKHTSTFGVRIYRRGSALIDHVDRMDTHLASAVIQIDQKVDPDGGWPLELLLPDRTVAEVYTQPGEIILYEGAWLRHGRPMRFKGDEFANVFSHFAPLDWDGPPRKGAAESAPQFYGIPDNRLTTLADTGYRKSTDFAPLPDDDRDRDDANAAAELRARANLKAEARRAAAGGPFDFKSGDAAADRGDHGEL